MRSWIGSLAVIAALASAVSAPSRAASAQSPQKQLPPGFIVIDGAKNPEQIPEHIMWSTGLDTIGMLHAKGIIKEGPLATLTLTKEDYALLLAEVGRHRARREDCQARGERIVESLKGQPEAKLEIALKSHTLECRVVMLDAKDQLMLKLSPEGVTTLNIWMLNERRKTRSIMPKSELEFYRLPR